MEILRPLQTELHKGDCNNKTCRDWVAGETNSAAEAIIVEHCGEKDAFIFIDGYVLRLVKSGLAYTVRVNGVSVADGSSQLT